MVYPKWLYHQTKEAVIVHDLEQEKALGEGWVESPALFSDEVKPLDPPAIETEDDLSEDQDLLTPESEQPQEAEKANELKKHDFLKMRVDELKAYLVERGASAEEVKSLRKDELIAKIGEL